MVSSGGCTFLHHEEASLHPRRVDRWQRSGGHSPHPLPAHTRGLAPISHPLPGSLKASRSLARWMIACAILSIITEARTCELQPCRNEQTDSIMCSHNGEHDQLVHAPLMVSADRIGEQVKAAVKRMKGRVPEGLPKYPLNAQDMPEELIRACYGGIDAPPMVEYPELDFITGNHPIRQYKGETPPWLKSCPHPAFKAVFHVPSRIPPRTASSHIHT